MEVDTDRAEVERGELRSMTVWGSERAFGVSPGTPVVVFGTVRPGPDGRPAVDAEVLGGGTADELVWTRLRWRYMVRAPALAIGVFVLIMCLKNRRTVTCANLGRGA